MYQYHNITSQALLINGELMHISFMLKFNINKYNLNINNKLCVHYNLI